MKFISKLVEGFADIFFPPLCHVCKIQIEPGLNAHICDQCLQSFKLLTPPFCSICGSPFSGAGTNHPCSRCIKHPPAWSSARSVFLYEGSCRDLIHLYKFGKKAILRKPLGMLTASALKPYMDECQPDLLLPVPLHRKRLQSRGFNQALLICEVLSSQWRLPLIRQGLRRSRNTPPQTELSSSERHVNISGAFLVPDPDLIRGKKIMLVDDVFTTGCTLNECAKTLMASGAGSVHAVTVARAPIPS